MIIDKNMTAYIWLEDKRYVILKVATLLYTVMASLVNITIMEVDDYNFNSDKYNYTIDNSDQHNTTTNCGEQLSDEDWETVSKYR